MTSHEEGGGHKYEQLKVRYDILVEKYLKLKRKHLERHDDSSDDFEPPTKKQKVLNIDVPFESLPPELCDKIFSYLTSKELLNAMGVSKTWKNFIESRDTKLDKIMDKFVLKVNHRDIKEITHIPLNRALSAARSFKHLETDFEFPRFPRAGSNRFPFHHYESSLESLKIICKFSSINLQRIQPANFTKLKKLIIECESVTPLLCHHESVMNFIKASSFPEVTHLKIFEFDPKATSLNQLMEKFPKLKVFYAFSPYRERNSSQQSDSEGESQEEEDRSIFSPDLRYNSFYGQPKIETVFLRISVNDLLEGFWVRITQLWLETVHVAALELVLTNLSNLKMLTICEDLWQFDEHDHYEGPEHYNLSTLKIGGSSLNDDSFRELLRSFPFLKTLVIGWELETGLVEFAATNMKYVDIIFCRSAPAEVLTFYNDIKENPALPNDGNFLNTQFNVLIDPDIFDFHQEFIAMNFDTQSHK